MQADITMAEKNNNRKSKRNFSLEKPVERRFDIEKDVDAAPVATPKPATPNQPTERTTQGRFDTSKATVTKPGGNVPPTIPNGGGDDNNDGENGSKKWIIIALIIVALTACAYFFMGGNKSDVVSADPETPQVEQNDSTQKDKNANDSTANAANESDESVTDGNGNAANDATADQYTDNKPEGLSAPQVSEPKLSAPAAKNQPVSNTHSNSSGISSQPTSSTPSSSIEQKAKDVWKGVYGNNPERRKNLGSDYEEVQKLVNKMHRQGLN